MHVIPPKHDNKTLHQQGPYNQLLFWSDPHWNRNPVLRTNRQLPRGTHTTVAWLIDLLINFFKLIIMHINEHI